MPTSSSQKKSVTKKSTKKTTASRKSTAKKTGASRATAKKATASKTKKKSTAKKNTTTPKPKKAIKTTKKAKSTTKKSVVKSKAKSTAKKSVAVKNVAVAPVAQEKTQKIIPAKTPQKQIKITQVAGPVASAPARAVPPKITSKKALPHTSVKQRDCLWCQSDTKAERSRWYAFLIVFILFFGGIIIGHMVTLMQNTYVVQEVLQYRIAQQAVDNSFHINKIKEQAGQPSWVLGGRTIVSYQPYALAFIDHKTGDVIVVPTLDSVTTAVGQNYMVMDGVNGFRITQHAFGGFRMSVLEDETFVWRKGEVYSAVNPVQLADDFLEASNEYAFTEDISPDYLVFDARTRMYGEYGRSTFMFGEGLTGLVIDSGRETVTFIRNSEVMYENAEEGLLTLEGLGVDISIDAEENAFISGTREAPLMFDGYVGGNSEATFSQMYNRITGVK